MGRLTIREIDKQRRRGAIHIEPFESGQLESNVNSYDLRLAPELAVLAVRSTHDAMREWDSGTYAGNGDAKSLLSRLVLAGARERPFVDVRKPPPLVKIELTDYHGKYGYVLYPSILYLASTIEEAGSDEWIPMVDGKSSLARLGLEVHKTAGFGDIGFKKRWTLEMEVTHPMLIYPGMRVAQVSFEQPIGTIGVRYSGGYKDQKGIAGSSMERYFDANGNAK